VTGTATPARNISVKVNGSVVGTTTSDSGGNWSVNVSGQTAGAKTIEATASYQQLYVNSINVGSLSDSVMTKLNPVNNQSEGTFSLFSNSTAPLFWTPNGDFTKAYGAAGPLGSPYIYTIDLVNGSVSSFLMAGTSPNPAVPAYNSDYSKVYIPDTDGFNDIVRVYNTTTNAEIGSGIVVGDCAAFAAYRPGTNEVWVSNLCDNTISVIDTVTDTVTDTHATAASVNCLNFTPDGSKLYALQCGTSNTIFEIDPDSGTTTDTITMPSGLPGYVLNMNSDGSKLYITNIIDNTLDALNTSTNAITQVVAVGTGPLGVVISPDDLKAYVTNANVTGGFSGNSISVVDLTSNSVTNTISAAVAPSVGWFAPVESASTSVSFTLLQNTNVATLANTGQSTTKIFIGSLILMLVGFGGIIIYLRRSTVQKKG
jgi:YVTN family beta-propeller protein